MSKQNSATSQSPTCSWPLTSVDCTPSRPPLDLAAEPLSSQSTLLWASSGPHPPMGQGSPRDKGYPAAEACKSLGWELPCPLPQPGLPPPRLS